MMRRNLYIMILKDRSVALAKTFSGKRYEFGYELIVRTMIDTEKITSFLVFEQKKSITNVLKENKKKIKSFL